MTPEEFRAAGHELIDWIADHRIAVPGLPVAATTAPGEVRRALPTSPPDGAGERDGIADLLADLDRVVVPGVLKTQHPAHFGWFPSNASLASVLGDLASSGIGALGITWESAPALTEVEEVVVDWMRQLTGLSGAWHGVIQDTASTACLVALIAARERASDYSARNGGVQAVDRPLVVYTTAQAHSMVAKAVLLAGFGQDNLRLVDVDPLTYAMDPAALASAMAADVAAGRRPAAVVATVGSTATTSVDPLAAVLAVTAGHDVWVHVDAAMAGSALLLPEFRWLVAGIDGTGATEETGGIGGPEDARAGVPGSDSLCWNPHKWLGTVLDCSLLYVRSPDDLVRVMSTSPSFLRSGADGQVTQYRDWGVPLGRRFRALKLWFQLRLDDVEQIRERLRRDLANAAWLAAQVDATPHWRTVAPVPLQTVCLRHEPPGLQGDALEAHTLAWVREINASGAAYLTAAQLDGRWMVRVSIGVEATERSDVEALWDLMRRTAEKTEELLPAGVDPRRRRS